MNTPHTVTHRTTQRPPLARTRKLAFLAYLLLLVTLTHWPQLQVELGPVPRPDLIAHLGAYATLATLLSLSTLLGPPHHARTLVRTLLITLPFAAIDEATQGIPNLNRTVSIDDLIANWLGLTIGATLTTTAASRIHKHTRSHHPDPNTNPDTHTDTHTNTHNQPGTHNTTPAGGNGFVSHARTFALVTVVSRVFGLARDALCAAVFGASPTWSAFATAFIIPNLLRRLLGEGSLAAAFIPTYTRLARDDSKTAHRLALITVLATGAATTIIALILATAALILINSPAAPPESSTRLVLNLTLIMLPFMPTVCMTAVLGAMLQVHNRFVPAAAASIVLNAFMIAAVTAAAFIQKLPAETAAKYLAASVALAGAAQLIWCLTELAGTVNWRTAAPNAWKHARSHFNAMLKRMGPVLIGLSTLQLGLLLDTLIAGWPVVVGPTIANIQYPMDASAAAVLYFAQRLYHLPVGVFAIALATAIFPALARLHDQPQPFTQTLRRGIRVSLFVGLPAALGLAAVAHPLVLTIYGGTTPTNTPAPDNTTLANAFTPDHAQRVTQLTIAYAAAIPFVGITHALTRAFYAKDDTTTPMKLATAAVALNLALNLTLIWPLAELGLAVASATTAAAQAAVLTRLARTRFTHAPDQPPANLLDRDTARSAAASLLAAAATAAAAYATTQLLAQPAERLLPTPRAAAAATLTAATAIGVITYTAHARLTRRPELHWILKRNQTPDANPNPNPNTTPNNKHP